MTELRGVRLRHPFSIVTNQKAMINIFKYIANYCRLKKAERTINTTSVHGLHRVNLDCKSMAKCSIVYVLRLKSNKKTQGILIATKKNKKDSMVDIQYIWIRTRGQLVMPSETLSAFYQTMFEIFMRWYTFSAENNNGITKSVSIFVDIKDTEVVERLRRILTLYEFKPNASYTIGKIGFTTPWRDKERINRVVYVKTL